MNPHCVTDARRECCGKLENGDWLLFRTWASWLRREKHQEYFTQCEPKVCDGGWNRAFLILVRIFLHKWPETKQRVDFDKEFHNCKTWRQPWTFVCFTFASDGDQIQTLDLNRFWSTYTNNHKANCRSLGFRLIYTSTPLLKVDNHGQIILQRNRWLILKGELKFDPNKLLTIAHFQDSHADSHLTQSLVESFFWKGEAEQWSLELTLRGFEVLKFCFVLGFEKGGVETAVMSISNMFSNTVQSWTKNFPTTGVSSMRRVASLSPSWQGLRTLNGQQQNPRNLLLRSFATGSLRERFLDFQSLRKYLSLQVWCVGDWWRDYGFLDGSLAGKENKRTTEGESEMIGNTHKWWKLSKTIFQDEHWTAKSSGVCGGTRPLIQHICHNTVGWGTQVVPLSRVFSFEVK